jgi:hypothetical protein
MNILEIILCALVTLCIMLIRGHAAIYIIKLFYGIDLKEVGKCNCGVADI